MDLLKSVKRNQSKFRSTPTRDVKAANRISKNTDEMEHKSKFRIDNVI